MAGSTVASCGVAAAAIAHRPAASAHLRPAAFGWRALPTAPPSRSSTAAGRQPAAAALNRRELLGSSAAAAALLPPALAAQGAAGSGAAMAASASAAPAAPAAIKLRDLKLEVDSHGMQRLALQPEGAPGPGGSLHLCKMWQLCSSAGPFCAQAAGQLPGLDSTRLAQMCCCTLVDCRVEQLEVEGSQHQLAHRCGASWRLPQQNIPVAACWPPTARLWAVILQLPACPPTYLLAAC
jgi:hypothetical protein